MGTIVVSSYTVTQQIAPKFFQASHRRCSLYFVQVRIRSLGKSASISSPSTVFSVKNELSKAGYGVPVEKLELGFPRARSVVTRSKKVEDGEQELSKDDRELPASWSSIQRANTVSKIFMAAFLYISLFFGISIMDNEMGGGGKGGRRRPRQ